LSTIPSTVTVTAEGLPVGASFDPETWDFNWTPSFDQAGTYVLKFRATDDGNGTGLPGIDEIVVRSR